MRAEEARSRRRSPRRRERVRRPRRARAAGAAGRRAADVRHRLRRPADLRPESPAAQLRRCRLDRAPVPRRPVRLGRREPLDGIRLLRASSSYVYAQVGVSLPHHAASQYGYGTPVPYDQLAPGDLVFFSGLGHVGIYIGGGQFVHAPHTGDVVEDLEPRRARLVRRRPPALGLAPPLPLGCAAYGSA